LLTLEWKSTASITAMSYSLIRCCQRSSTLQPIRLSFNKTTLHFTCQGHHYTATVRNAWLHWTPNSHDLNLVDYKIRSGVLSGRECMIVVWIVSMSWICASLTSGTVCSRTLLTYPSTSGESDWERACVQMDNILNIYCERMWLTKVMDK